MRELTQAVVALVRDRRGPASPWSGEPAAGVPEGCTPRPGPVEFTSGDLPALHGAGVRYLRDESAVRVRITGTVVRLRRSRPRGAGVVPLRVLTGAEVNHVRLEPDEQAYEIAGHAHLAGPPVRVEGRLESRGGFRRPTRLSRVAPVRVDEAECDRLMKTLQGGADSVEEERAGEEGHPGTEGSAGAWRRPPPPAVRAPPAVRPRRRPHGPGREGARRGSGGLRRQTVSQRAPAARYDSYRTPIDESVRSP